MRSALNYILKLFCMGTPSLSTPTELNDINDLLTFNFIALPQLPDSDLELAVLRKGLSMKLWRAFCTNYLTGEERQSVRTISRPQDRNGESLSSKSAQSLSCMGRKLFLYMALPIAFSKCSPAT